MSDIYNRSAYTNGIDGTSVKLTDLTFDQDSGGYYLSAKYAIEDKYSVRELYVPKIRLFVNKSHVMFKQEGETFTRPEVDIGFGWLPLSNDRTPSSAYFTETVIKEKVQEMTLEEIEKKLGYRIKVVTRKEEE